MLPQQQVEQKTSEIAWFAPLLDQIDLTEVVVTRDPTPAASGPR